MTINGNGLKNHAKTKEEQDITTQTLEGVNVTMESG